MPPGGTSDQNWTAVTSGGQGVLLFTNAGDRNLFIYILPHVDLFFTKKNTISNSFLSFFPADAWVDGLYEFLA